ncbi:endonuclease/exonuclease/phosphatase family protein [Luteimonas aquatica]|uniref:endonuclease/exonuclease/phosphatase family protein n=1 Tax=Luteimonas aquatica TaxID=450364 RepID=UPI001F5ADD7F|nr:endonuclease/exonuclease/phosphatase family protein [Luteimonas aquatica]
MRTVPLVLLALLSLALLSSAPSGCRSAPRAAADGKAHAGPAPAAALEVVTLNLWHDKGDWPRRREMIVAALRASRPDAIFLQEVLQDAGLPNQAEDLARALGYACFFVSVDPPDRTRRYGNAVLTRHPVRMRAQRALRPPEDYRVAGMVRADVGGQPLNLYVTHLNFTDASGATRARQIGDLLAFVDATRGDAPSVIAGDFNVGAAAPELAPLRARYTDAFAALHAAPDAPANTTLNPHYGHPRTRIDHVFLQTGVLMPVRARIVLDRPDASGTWPSDHFGLQVGFRRE